MKHYIQCYSPLIITPTMSVSKKLILYYKWATEIHGSLKTHPTWAKYRKHYIITWKNEEAWKWMAHLLLSKASSFLDANDHLGKIVCNPSLIPVGLILILFFWIIVQFQVLCDCWIKTLRTHFYIVSLHLMWIIIFTNTGWN